MLFNPPFFVVGTVESFIKKEIQPLLEIKMVHSNICYYSLGELSLDELERFKYM